MKGMPDHAYTEGEVSRLAKKAYNANLSFRVRRDPRYLDLLKRVGLE